MSSTNNSVNSVKVLVVESDVPFFNRLYSMLKNAALPDQNTDLEIIPAGSLREAIDKLEVDTFDVI